MPSRGMLMQRRDLVTLGGLMLASLASAAQAQSAAAKSAAPKPSDAESGKVEELATSGLYPGGLSSLLHVWTDAQGVSHAEHLVIAKDVKPIPVTQMMIRPETKGVVDWHNPRTPAFAITIEGELEVEVTDGTRLALPPSRMAFLEDSTGKGHITRARDVVNLFLSTPPGFDVRRWAKGEG
jgi:hypothetical protein